MQKFHPPHKIHISLCKRTSICEKKGIHFENDKGMKWDELSSILMIFFIIWKRRKMIRTTIIYLSSRNSFGSYKTSFKRLFSHLEDFSWNELELILSNRISVKSPFSLTNNAQIYFTKVSIQKQMRHSVKIFEFYCHDFFSKSLQIFREIVALSRFTTKIYIQNFKFDIFGAILRKFHSYERVEEDLHYSNQLR